ncbi:hypothetical protein H8356DRAFT_1421040 [Neocallimastix lanati (nom. inval.)]|nr:hypothetical protein H8356DRAFT_1421040 [Neocallimastix sp. JGI-2020a]
MSKSENSTITDSSTKTLTNTTDTAKTINTLKTTMNDVPNIKDLDTNKKHLKYDKIENNNFKLFLDNLNSLLQNITMRKKQKLYIYSLEEFNKVGIAYSFTFLYVEKIFKGLKKDISKISTIIKKDKSIKRIYIKEEVYQHEDQINIISIKKQIPMNITTISIKMEKENNNNKSRNKNKNKRISLSGKGSKRIFKYYNVNYEEQNNSESGSDPSFNFCSLGNNTYNVNPFIIMDLKPCKNSKYVIITKNNILNKNLFRYWHFDMQIIAENFSSTISSSASLVRNSPSKTSWQITSATLSVSSLLVRKMVMLWIESGSIYFMEYN